VARHFSMLRDFHVADFLTLANGFCGVLAVFQSMLYVARGERLHLYIAAALVPIALVFDVLDGRVARSRGSASSLGRELDSLADVISFGVAPAAIAFAAGLDTMADQLILVFFALCGLSRLARFNVTAQSREDESEPIDYFEGTPIPTSVVPLALTMAAFATDALFPVSIAGVALHLPVLLFFLSGCLMISKTLRIPKL
jgi:CDP-diacylglycerol---serine O-phosphatidyltransferase